MDEAVLRRLLQQVQQGEVAVEAAVEQLRLLPFVDLGEAKLDLHRSLRKGFPEVVLAAGKTPEQVRRIVERLIESHGVVLCTRADAAAYAAVSTTVPDAVYDAVARIIHVRRGAPRPPHPGQVAVVCAGTSDLPVAEEAAVTLETMGFAPQRIYDVGVAGLHRLLAHLPALRQAQVLIAVAGMEGALPGVLAGLVPGPVIAVPTSVGYGTGLGGLAAVLSMLNTCAPGVTVVNIDNGFGAAYAAALMLARKEP